MSIDQAVLDGIADSAEREFRSQVRRLGWEMIRHDVDFRSLGFRSLPTAVFDPEEIEDLVQIKRRQAVEQAFDKLRAMAA